jgi:hypothetical protein
LQACLLPRVVKVGGIWSRAKRPEDIKGRFT